MIQLGIMARNYTSLHTPIDLEHIEKKALKNQGKSSVLTKLDIVLIFIGLTTTLVLGVLVYMLVLRDSGLL